MAVHSPQKNTQLTSFTSYQLLGAFFLLFFTCLTYFGVQQIANQTAIDNQSTQEQLRQYRNMKVALHSVATRQTNLIDANSQQEIFNNQRLLLAASDNLQELLSDSLRPMEYVRAETKSNLVALVKSLLSLQQNENNQTQNANSKKLQLHSLEDLIFSHLTLLGDNIIAQNQNRNESRQQRLTWFIFAGVIIAILYVLGFAILLKHSQKTRADLKFSENVIIEERKKSTASLINSEEKFHKAFNASPHIFAITDLLDSTIIEVNTAFTRTTGWTRDEAIGKSSADLNIWPLENQVAFMKLVKELGQISNWDTVFKTKSGEDRAGIISAEIIDLAGRPCFLGAIEDVTDRKNAETEILQSRERLRKLAQRIEEVREEERIGIARELHDELGQSLTGLKIDLSNLADKTSISPNGLTHIEMMLANIDTTIDVVRRMSSDLRPPILDHLGLEAALESLSNDFSKRTGIACSLTLDCEDLPLNKTWDTAVYRIYQESLVNIARHSQATKFEASACIIDNVLKVYIRDDGVGISQKQIEHSTSIGLLGMQERATNIGASFSISNSDLGGVEVALIAPITPIQE